MNEKSADIYNSFKGGYDGFNFYDRLILIGILHITKNFHL